MVPALAALVRDLSCELLVLSYNDESWLSLEELVAMCGHHAAVRTLPAAQRAAITLHYVDGLSYARIAALTRTTIPAVRSNLFRGRRALAATLSSWR